MYHIVREIVIYAWDDNPVEVCGILIYVRIVCAAKYQMVKAKKIFGATHAGC